MLYNHCVNIIHKAKQRATQLHKGQFEDTGKPYITHPAQVVKILSLITNDPDILAAAWLHDTIEDTTYTYEQAVAEFGNRVADLIMEVTHESATGKGNYYFPRLKTRDGILIKFADRLTNIARMETWDEKRKAQYMRKSTFWKSAP